MVTLFSFWRSTTSYRVRIALNLKSVKHQQVPVNLIAGEQSDAAYSMINPGQGVPSLVLSDGTVLTQSMAILDWLDHEYPDPPLLPENPSARAQVLSAALVIATDIHPINNLRVVAELERLGHSQDETADWMRLWMARGFATFEALIRNDTPFCFGDDPGLADLCLIPQLFNAHRWDLDLAPYERLTDIEQRCLAIPAFESARPENQPDVA